jgi:hypothetical protein
MKAGGEERRGGHRLRFATMTIIVVLVDGHAAVSRA